MKRIQSILFAALLALSLSATTLAGDITGRSSTVSGDITGKAGDITGLLNWGDITGLIGTIFGMI